MNDKYRAILVISLFAVLVVGQYSSSTRIYREIPILEAHSYEYHIENNTLYYFKPGLYDCLVKVKFWDNYTKGNSCRIVHAIYYKTLEARNLSLSEESVRFIFKWYMATLGVPESLILFDWLKFNFTLYYNTEPINKSKITYRSFAGPGEGKPYSWGSYGAYLFVMDINRTGAYVVGEKINKEPLQDGTYSLALQLEMQSEVNYTEDMDGHPYNGTTHTDIPVHKLADEVIRTKIINDTYFTQVSDIIGIFILAAIIYSFWKKE